MNKQNKPKVRGRRYIYHNRTGPLTKVYLVYYYTNETVVLMSDGPYGEEPSAAKRMRYHLLKGNCAWMVVYND